MKSKVGEELKQHFRPEFLNRVDDIIVFHQLSRDEIFRIVDLMITKVDERLKDRDMGIELRPAAKELLSERGYDPVLGARPLRRTIQREIEDHLSEKILFSELKAGQIVVVDAEGGTGPEATSRSRASPSPTRFRTLRPRTSTAKAAATGPRGRAGRARRTSGRRASRSRTQIIE